MATIFDVFIKLYAKVKDTLSPEDKSYYEARIKEWGDEGLKESPKDVPIK